MDGEGDAVMMGGQDPFIMMEQILDMLKLLDYENKFCKQKGFKPISKVYFAQQHQNPSEQFINFISLVSWLLFINNHQVSGWSKYDDPMTASQNIILELQKLGIDLDMPPNKLKTGFGEGVCTVLGSLCQMSLQNTFRYKPLKLSQIKDEAGGFGDEEADEMVDEFEGNADVADMMHDKQSDNDDIDDDLEFGGPGAVKDAQNDQELIQQEIIHSQIGKEEWMLEVERVTHKLRISKVGNDGKEWRSHMDQTKKYHEAVKSNLPDVRYKLERLSEDVSKALEKIGKKEQVLTRSFQGMTGDYRAHSDNLKEIQNKFNSMTKNVQELETELQEVNEKLTRTQDKIDDTGKSFSDNAPLQNIKKSISQIKNDIRSIDIRIGVVSNTLLQLKLKERQKQIEDGKPIDILDNQYELDQ